MDLNVAILFYNLTEDFYEFMIGEIDVRLEVVDYIREKLYDLRLHVLNKFEVAEESTYKIFEKHSICKEFLIQLDILNRINSQTSNMEKGSSSYLN